MKTPSVRSGGIYAIVHIATSRRYIGSTTNLVRRSLCSLASLLRKICIRVIEGLDSDYTGRITLAVLIARLAARVPCSPAFARGVRPGSVMAVHGVAVHKTAVSARLIAFRVLDQFHQIDLYALDAHFSTFAATIRCASSTRGEGSGADLMRRTMASSTSETLFALIFA